MAKRDCCSSGFAVGFSRHYFVWWSSSFYLLALIQLLVLVNSSAATSGPVINVTKHISFTHFSLDDPSVLSDVKLLGSAKFSMEKSVIQIPDESEAFNLRHQAGRAIYSSPVRLLDPYTHTPASFQTTFSFQFSNSSNASVDGDGPSHGGSGLTFIIVPDEFTVGRPGPWLGMLNDACQEDYKAVGIEFDTRQNPEFGDPNDNHVGINLASIVSTKAIDASDFGVFLNDGSVHRAWITYDGPRRWMDIHLGSDGHPSKPVFSGSLDLSPHLNEYMFIGFSASTGNKTQIHNVLSWNFSATSQAFLRFPSEETCESKITLHKSEAAQSQTTQKRSNKEPSSSFFIFIAVAVLALATMIGFIFCSRRGRNDNSKLTAIPY
ncbi:hypothetical protein Godav_002048 [Gossypium davidsonii]|uniref:Legume lectin domain-containing protein n=1 Tax=Gossypium davidsonii TaxID=34287 RepID=A0A7J8SUX1_GOSDV|nr:hypothetical protein [Gossypium davidsonii]